MTHAIIKTLRWRLHRLTHGQAQTWPEPEARSRKIMTTARTEYIPFSGDSVIMWKNTGATAVLNAS